MAAAPKHIDHYFTIALRDSQEECDALKVQLERMQVQLDRNANALMESRGHNAQNRFDHEAQLKAVSEQLWHAHQVIQRQATMLQNASGNLMTST